MSTLVQRATTYLSTTIYLLYLSTTQVIGTLFQSNQSIARSKWNLSDKICNAVKKLGKILTVDDNYSTQHDYVSATPSLDDMAGFRKNFRGRGAPNTMGVKVAQYVLLELQQRTLLVIFLNQLTLGWAKVTFGRVVLNFAYA